MKRRRNQPPLRGSVTQNASGVRLRADKPSPFGFLLRLGALTASLLLLVGLAAWLWTIGWPQKQAARVIQAGLHLTQKAQFTVKDIVIEGRKQTTKEALTLAIGTGSGDPILSFNPTSAQNRIARLPWVASVVVERRLPDTIKIQLTERMPLARWQHQGVTRVIDDEGNSLPDASPDSFPQLPLVVGAEAPEATKELMETLKTFPAVAEKMTAAVWVSERRWDIHLRPKIIARLPESNMTAALKQLSLLITEQKILDRPIVAIDLRLSDRLIIESGSTPSNHPAGDLRL